MSPAIPQTLLEWARLPGPRKVLARARRRLEEGHGLHGRPLSVHLTADERADVGRLLGTAWALSNRPVRADALAAAVADVGSDLEALLQALNGPLRDLPAARAAARAAVDAERRAAHEVLIRAGIDAATVESWLSSRGIPRAGTGALRELAEQVAAVLRKLPAHSDTILLPVLAADALNDPHGLDRGSRIATAVLRLAARPSENREQGEAEAWRSAWESLGVVCDELSSRVLVLNLLLRGDAAACRLTAAAASEPIWLTWRSLTGTFATDEARVFICENPAILAEAANRLGLGSPPMICTNGRPSGATRRLIAGLVATGTIPWVRADDDPAGQQIVAELCTIAPAARLWRYERRQHEGSPPANLPVRYEEQDLELLLADLNAASNGRLVTQVRAEPWD